MADPAVGDFASVTLACDFSPITPLGDIFFGDPIAMSATSTFPIREGCVNCPEPPPAVPHRHRCSAVRSPTSPTCLSRERGWHGHPPGSIPPTSFPLTGQDHETVASFVVTEDDPLSNCEFPTLAVFSSSIVVTITPPDPETPPPASPSPTCSAPSWVTPTTLGRTPDSPAISPRTGAILDPRSEPGHRRSGHRSGIRRRCRLPRPCLDRQRRHRRTPAGTATVAVPRAEPDHLKWNEGLAAWTGEDFERCELRADLGNFKIGNQSFVGGTYVPCTASIVVGPGGGGGGGGGGR